jgi:hypothetical protein
MMPANLRTTKANGGNTPPEPETGSSAIAIQARVDGVDWTQVQADLNARVGPSCRSF